ncbi:MAG: methyltransferase domain-containing protein [Actinomycetota bacterium]|nr:methyltransferase domain-containing protein [Actinomycetota bacterium]
MTPTQVVPAASQDARELLAAGDPQAAVRRLEAAVAFGETSAAVHHDLVRAYEQVGRLDDAVELLGRLAVALPARRELQQQLGALSSRALAAGRVAAATWAAERLTELDPASRSAWSRLVAARRRAGDVEGVRAALIEWDVACPGDDVAEFFLSVYSGGQVAAAPAEHVRRLFDMYAPQFDHHLALLDYRAPRLVADRLAVLLAARSPAAAATDLADLGCGTGQVGELVRDLTKRLAGVDLSPGMLQKADERGCYDELLAGDLVEFLTARPGMFDVLVSADTLNYLGELQPALSAARAALRTGGVVLFTLERGTDLPASGYRLRESGRFEHDPVALRARLVSVGFGAITIEECVLRREGTADVVGLLVDAVAI